MCAWCTVWLKTNWIKNIFHGVWREITNKTWKEVAETSASGEGSASVELVHLAWFANLVLATTIKQIIFTLIIKLLHEFIMFEWIDIWISGGASGECVCI